MAAEFHIHSVLLHWVCVVTAPLPSVAEEADTDQETDRLLGQQRTGTGDTADSDKVSSKRVLSGILECNWIWGLLWSGLVSQLHSLSIIYSALCLALCFMARITQSSGIRCFIVPCSCCSYFNRVFPRKISLLLIAHCPTP